MTVTLNSHITPPDLILKHAQDLILPNYYLADIEFLSSRCSAGRSTAVWDVCNKTETQVLVAES